MLYNQLFLTNSPGKKIYEILRSSNLHHSRKFSLNQILSKYRHYLFDTINPFIQLYLFQIFTKC